MAMTLGQYMIVRVTPDEKSYTYWTVDPAYGGPALPNEPPQATRTTSSSTLGTAVQNNMPTLST
jgi:hypothetical protein